MIKLPIDRTQLCLLVFVVTVAIAFVFSRTTFIFGCVTFVGLGGIKTLALFAAMCCMAVPREVDEHMRQKFSRIILFFYRH